MEQLGPSDFFLLFVVVVFITVPLLLAIARINQLVRIMSRIEHLNLRSVQRWGV
jgi:hypothetical protein